MSKKKSAVRRAVKFPVHARRHSRRRQAAVISLGLVIIAAGVALARRTQFHAPRLFAAAPAAPPSPQNNLAPAAPSKEYIYVGGRLVATEEPLGPANQTITFAQPPDRVYGQALFTLSASASSGLPVTFTVVSGPAAVAGATLTITGAGTVAIRADQQGNSGFRPAPSVTRTFTVAKAAASIALGNLAQVYNGTPRLATVTTNPPGLGGVSVTYNGSTTAPTNAGSYRVAATLNNNNYAANTVTGTLVIARATPTITWTNPADIAHGTALGATQLNAATGVPGTFTYSPPAGTVLNPGLNQQLAVTFTPTNTANYISASASVRINVYSCPQSLGSSFTAPSPIAPGTSIPLSWSVPHATSVTISGVPGTFDGFASVNVSPLATITYTLTATGAVVCAPLTRQTTVSVRPCPTVAGSSLAAGATSIRAGDSTLLSWNTPDAVNVRISVAGMCQPNDDACDPTVFSGAYMTGGGVSVSPTTTTTYVMAVGGAHGCAAFEKEVTVNVTPNPTLCSPGAYFEADPSAGACGGDITLYWSMPNATSVTITDNHGTNYGTFGAEGMIGVGPTSDTTYFLSPHYAGNAACSTVPIETTHVCRALPGSPPG